MKTGIIGRTEMGVNNSIAHGMIARVGTAMKGLESENKLTCTKY